MRFSLLTRVSLAFCLIALSASALLWTYISTQNRIMARYEIIRSNDTSALRDIKNATLLVSTLRRGILEKDRKDLERNLRLATRLQPTDTQLKAYIQRLDAREAISTPFAERATFQEDITRHVQRLKNELDQLPQHSATLYHLVQNAPSEDQRIQDEIARTLIVLDQIDDAFRNLQRTIQERQEVSFRQLKRDQVFAERMTIATAVLTCLAFLIAIALVWRGLAPITRLTRATTAVAEGKFDIARVRAGNDEIGQLAESFHSMTRALSQRERDLQSANALREQVYQRLLDEEKSRRKAEQLAAIGALSSRITHELRNPLSSLSLNIDMILEDPNLMSLEADTQDMLVAIQDEIARLEELSSGYLDLTKIQEPRRVPLELSALLRSRIFHMEPSLKRERIQLTTEIASDLWVEGDTNALGGLLVNLLENARIAVDKNESTRALHVVLFADGDVVVCSVEDNGPGVSHDLVTTLFDAFVTDRSGGTGLGLSISREIAESLGGTLTYTQSKMGGACFVLTLPRVMPARPSPVSS